MEERPAYSEVRAEEHLLNLVGLGEEGHCPDLEVVEVPLDHDQAVVGRLQTREEKAERVIRWKDGYRSGRLS